MIKKVGDYLKKHFKKVVAILLLLFISFLAWLDSYEPKKEQFKHSDFYLENVKQNEKIVKNSKLYNSEYRKSLEKEIEEKQKQKQEQEQQEQEQEQEEQEHKSKRTSNSRNKNKNKKKKEDDGKIKEKTKRARIQKEKENNRLDRYIFKHKMKSKKRP